MGDSEGRPTTPIRILLVEDSADDALLLARALRSAGLDFVVHRVDTAEDMREALEDEWDIVLADFAVPGFGALPALEILRGTNGDLPLVTVSGAVGEEQAAEIFRAGARDFVLKGNLARLAPVIRREIEQARVRHRRREAEEALERERIRHAALIRNAADVVWIVDDEGRITFTSPAVEDLTGRSPEELAGRELLDLVHPEDRADVRDLVARTERSDVLVRRGHRVIAADGKVRHVESLGRAIDAAEGVRGTIVNTRDVSERRHLEEQLLQAQKMEAVGKLAGGIAHDFNNLLTVVTGSGHMVLQTLDEHGLDTDDIDRMLDAADRAAALTRQLLAFSRRQVLQPRVVDVREVVEGVVGMLRRITGDDISLELELADEPCPSRVDPVQLEQVVMNLGVNAQEVLPNGGHVAVAVRRVRIEPDAGPDGLDPGEWVCISFEDDGPGMREEVRQRVFEPFFTTKNEGTGLGLSTVYGIVNQSGGRVTVDSTLGEGTTFRVFLPHVASGAGPRTESVRRDGSEATLSGRVLLVEDDDDVRRVARRVLERGGLEVVTAASAEEGLTRFRDDPRPDLVITDLVMPGISGRELAEKLRSADPDLPLLFMSGYSGEQVLEHREVPEGIGFLQKPFTPGELLARVEGLMKRRAP